MRTQHRLLERPGRPMDIVTIGVALSKLPRRLGMRDGQTSDSVETPVALEECLALGLQGVHGIVVDSKA